MLYEVPLLKSIVQSKIKFFEHYSGSPCIFEYFFITDSNWTHLVLYFRWNICNCILAMLTVAVIWVIYLTFHFLAVCKQEIKYWLFEFQGSKKMCTYCPTLFEISDTEIGENFLFISFVLFQKRSRPQCSTLIPRVRRQDSTSWNAASF